VIGITGGHGQGDSSPRIKLTRHVHLAGFDGFDEVFEDTIDDLFVEGGVIAEGEEVEFERLAFETETMGNIVDGDDAEIRLTGDGAEGGEFGAMEPDMVGAVGVGVLEGFETSLVG